MCGAFFFCSVSVGTAFFVLLAQLMVLPVVCFVFYVFLFCFVFSCEGRLQSAKCTLPAAEAFPSLPASSNNEDIHIWSYVYIYTYIPHCAASRRKLNRFICGTAAFFDEKQQRNVHRRSYHPPADQKAWATL